MKKILFINQNSSVPEDKRIWNEAKTLKNQGYKISVICPKHNNHSFEIIDKIQIHRFPFINFKNHFLEYIYSFMIIFFLSLKILIKQGFDIIHSGNPPDIFCLIGLFYKLFGKKYIFDQHDLTPELYLSIKKTKNIIHYSLRLFEKLSYKIADKVIVTNNSYKELALERKYKNQKYIFIVRNGPSNKILKINIIPNRNIKQNFKYLVSYFGLINPQDDLDILIRIINDIINIKNRREILFLIIGDGSALKNIKKLAKKYSLKQNIQFTGFLPYKKALTYIKTSDICVAPENTSPLNNYSTFVKIMDYMLCSKPIVAFDLKETGYTAQKAALYAKPNNIKDFGDKILELLDNKKLRQKIDKFGRRRIESKLCWDKVKQPLLDCYESLIKKI